MRVDSFGLFANGAYSGSLTTTTDASGAYAFNGLPSFVYAQGAYTADGRTETSANPGIYQPGTKLADGIIFTGPNGTVENDHNVNTDKLYLVSYRLVLSEVAPSFSLTKAHVGVNIETDVIDGDGMLSTTPKSADHPGADVTNDTNADPVRDTTGTNGREDLDSDAIRTGDDFGTIEMREEYFDGAIAAWRTDGYVLVSDHARKNDGHQYQGVYGSGVSGQVFYDVPDPMGLQRGGDAGLVAVPRADITGRVWNDSALGSASDDSYNGIQDAGEPGLKNEVVFITQWYWAPVTTGEGDATTTWKWVQNTAFGTDRYTSNRDGAYTYNGTTVEAAAKPASATDELETTPIMFNGNTNAPLDYVYADKNGNRVDAKGVAYKKGDVVDGKAVEVVPGVLATTTGTMGSKDENGTAVPDDSKLGLYHFANLPTAYVSEDDQYYLAAYRIELADVEHTENNDGSDNQWLLTRSYQDDVDASGKTAWQNRLADSDATDVTVRGAAGGIKIVGSYDESGKQVRANDGQVILAGIRGQLGEGLITTNPARTSTAKSVVTVPANQAMDTVNGVAYDWTRTASGPAAEIVDGRTRVHGGDVGEVQAPVESITGRIWFDDDNDGKLSETADRDATVAEGSKDTMADEVAVTLERYYAIVGTDENGTYTWYRDDEKPADKTIEGKSIWATSKQWEDYDADPVKGLGSAEDHAKATSPTANDAKGAGDGLARTVLTTKAAPAQPAVPPTEDNLEGTPAKPAVEGGQFAFDNLKTQEWVTIDGVKTQIIYGYKLRVTDERLWDRSFGAAKLHATTGGITYANDSDLVYSDGYLMGAEEYDVLLQKADDNSPVSNRRVAPNSKNDNNGEDVQAKGTPDMTSPNRLYDMAWGITRARNDGGLRTPIFQKIAGLLWRDADDDFASVRDTDYNGLRDSWTEDDGDDAQTYTEPGLAGKRVILKQWYWNGTAWTQNTAFGNDYYTRAENGTDVANDAAGAKAAGATIIPNSTFDATEGGVWVITDQDGNYDFSKLPTRYVAKRSPVTTGEGDAAVTVTGMATEYLAGYTVEVLGNVNDASLTSNELKAQAVTGLPATLLQKRTEEGGVADDVRNSEARSVTASATIKADGKTANGNYELRWNEETAQDTYVDYTKHTLAGKIVLAGVAQLNDTTNNIDASPDQSTVPATATNREGGDARIVFDWNRGRDELNLDGGFGAFDTGSVTGRVFQDKDVDGFYNPQELVGGKYPRTSDKPVAGETLQISQWFFVPASETDTIAALEAAKYEKDESASDDGVWFKSKSFSYRTNLSELPDGVGSDPDDKALDSRIIVDANGYFEGAVTDGDGLYTFDELTSYVYVDALDGDVLGDVQPYFAGRKHVNLPIGSIPAPTTPARHPSPRPLRV